MTDVFIMNPDCEIADSAETIFDSAIIHGYKDSTAQAYAEQYDRTFVAIQNEVASVNCSEAVSWTLYEDGKLVIDGAVSIPDYANTKDIPWNSIKDKVTAIEINKAVTYIGTNAFGICTKAKTIEFFNSNCKIADNTNVIADTTKIIGYKGSAIDSYASKYGKTFTSLIASGKCGEAAKWSVNKSGLLNITGSGAMDNYENATQTPWYDNRFAITNVKMSNTITSMGTCSFASLSKMESITLSTSITEIPNAAIAGCQQLKSITLPEGVTIIGMEAFRNSKIKKISLPKTLEQIGDSTFFECTMLAEIDIPDNVHTIGDGAFSECKNLRRIHLPDSLTAISSGLFASCPLSEVTIPEKVKIIGYQAFFNCGMESIILPASVEKIEYNAFTAFDIHNITILNPNCEIPDDIYALYDPKVVISGYKGSTAQKYAEKYGYKFITLTK